MQFDIRSCILPSFATLRMHFTAITGAHKHAHVTNRHRCVAIIAIIIVCLVHDGKHQILQIVYTSVRWSNGFQRQHVRKRYEQSSVEWNSIWVRARRRDVLPGHCRHTKKLPLPKWNILAVNDARTTQRNTSHRRYTAVEPKIETATTTTTCLSSANTFHNQKQVGCETIRLSFFVFTSPTLLFYFYVQFLCICVYLSLFFFCCCCCCKCPHKNKRKQKLKFKLKLKYSLLLANQTQ